jgi:hypothetical protein
VIGAFAGGLAREMAGNVAGTAIKGGFAALEFASELVPLMILKGDDEP